MAKVAVVGGLGRVGLVLSVCLADRGNIVSIIDSDEEKVERIRRFIFPFEEPQVEELFRKNFNKFVITTDMKFGVANADAIFIAVPTPTKNGVDLLYIMNVFNELGQCFVKNKLIFINSTVPAGTADSLKREYKDKLFNCCIISNPEFLAEGSAVDDFNDGRQVFGFEAVNGERIIKGITSIFNFTGEDIANDQIYFTVNRVAEMAKYVNNNMLALKLAFINNVATICEAKDINAREVLKIVSFDERLGKGYINPGAGFGGSCLGKDTRGMMGSHFFYGSFGNLILNLNDAHKLYIAQDFVNRIDKSVTQIVGVAGLGFKAGVDDARESSALDIVEELIILDLFVYVSQSDPAYENFIKHYVEQSKIHNFYSVGAKEFRALEYVLVLQDIVDWYEFLKGGNECKFIYDACNSTHGYYDVIEKMGIELFVFGGRT